MIPIMRIAQNYAKRMIFKCFTRKIPLFIATTLRKSVILRIILCMSPSGFPTPPLIFF